MDITIQRTYVWQTNRFGERQLHRLVGDRLIPVKVEKPKMAVRKLEGDLLLVEKRGQMFLINEKTGRTLDLNKGTVMDTQSGLVGNVHPGLLDAEAKRSVASWLPPISNRVKQVLSGEDNTLPMLPQGEGARGVNWLPAFEGEDDDQ